MLSSLSNLWSMRNQAKRYSSQAKIFDANAQAARNAGNAQAANIESAARQNQSIAALNLGRARTNQRASLQSIENARSASGFTSEGTSMKAVENAQKTLDTEIANLAMSSSIASLNAWQGAIDARRKGEVAAMQQEAQAEQYRMASKSIRKQMLINGITAIGSAVGTGILQYNKTTARNDALRTQLDKNLISKDQYDAAYRNPFAAGSFAALGGGASAGFHLANTFSPYTAALSANANNRRNNYGGPLSVLLGNIPYNPTTFNPQF